MADSRHLENKKTAISPELFERSARICRDDATWPSKMYQMLKVRTFKNQRWRTAAMLKNLTKRPFVLAVWPTGIKFGTFTNFEPLNGNGG